MDRGKSVPDAGQRNRSKKPKELKWRNPRGLGAVYVRQGWLWTSIGDHRATTKIRWPGHDPRAQREALRQALDLLRERVLAHEHPELVTQKASESHEVRTLYAAIADFKRSKFPELATNARREFAGAFATYLVGAEDGDMHLGFAELRERIIRRRDASPIALETARKRLQKLNLFLDYCVENGWLDRNPARTIGKPTRKQIDQEQDPDRIFSSEEIEAMIAWFGKHDLVYHALLVRFLARTGLRISEALKLKWEHVTDDHFRVLGKRTTANKSGVRYFALRDSDGHETVPGILDVMRELREYRGDEVHVFPWRAQAPVQRVHKQCRKAIGIDDGRSIHSLRATAIWYWREVLGWSVELRSEAAGHSIDVQIKYYHRRRTPDEMMKAVATAKGGNGNGAGK